MSQSNPSRPLRPPIVLIVDDHLDTRELYSQALALHGYETVEASDGFEAWDKANAVLPDVIVTDVGLPRMDGIELTRMLKANGPTSRIPVIALTGFGPSAISERGGTATFAKLLVKPCAPEVLIAALCALSPGVGDGKSRAG